MSRMGFPYRNIDITLCIFDDSNDWPDPLIAFLYMVKEFNPEVKNTGGAILGCKPYKNKYQIEYADDEKILESIYLISKRKILSKGGIKLIYEGRILNDARTS